MGQLGFFDTDKRLEALSAKGDPLEAIELARAVGELSRRGRGCGAHGGRAEEERSAGRKPVRWPTDVQDAGSASGDQSVGQEKGGISGARPAVVLALSGARRDQGARIPSSHDALAVPREAGQGRGDREAVRLLRPASCRQGLHGAWRADHRRQYRAGADAAEQSRRERRQLQAGRTPAAWKQKPAKVRQKDRDARWTKKHGRSFFGYKNHVNARDAKHKKIRHYAVTDAAVHDSQELDGLLDTGNTCNDVFADSAYRSTKIEGRLRASGLKSRIHRRATRNHPLSNAQLKANRNRSKIRARIEHVFGAQDPRRAAGSCARSASCGHAPRLACRTWPTTFAAL